MLNHKAGLDHEPSPPATLLFLNQLIDPQYPFVCRVYMCLCLSVSMFVQSTCPTLYLTRGPAGGLVSH